MRKSGIWFLTGTDTEIGKTHAACQLLARARRQGLRAAGIKAVAAGVDETGVNEDARALAAASSVPLPSTIQNPYCFKAPLSPHLAAAQEGRAVDLNEIVAAVAEARMHADRVLVEGAGGFLCPLGETLTMADLVQALGVPVIVVVGLRLGCLNHARLTVEAIESRQLILAGWIANCIDPNMAALEGNLTTLRRTIPAPCLGVIAHGSRRDEIGWLRWPDEIEMKC